MGDLELGKTDFGFGSVTGSFSFPFLSHLAKSPVGAVSLSGATLISSPFRLWEFRHNPISSRAVMEQVGKSRTARLAGVLLIVQESGRRIHLETVVIPVRSFFQINPR